MPSGDSLGTGAGGEMGLVEKSHGKRDVVLAVGVSVIEKPVGSVDDESFGVEGRAL